MHIVRMENITKVFPGVVANDNILFTVKPQTIHCLLGENGSGKTTLMNILFGLYEQDEGDIYINNELVKINRPLDAQKYGIGMVHQHFMLINQYTVWENVILGSETGKFKLDVKKAKEEVQTIIDRYKFNLDINAKVRDLSVGMKQRVEIIKLIYRSANIIIFDEPTAVLTPQEVIELFGIFKTLIERGRTIIFITHKLEEIFEISDYVTVLRKGQLVGSESTSKLSEKTLSEMMVGRQIQEIEVEQRKITEDPILEITDLILIPDKKPISLRVNKGEILGVAGIDGNGQMELEETITGVRPIISGAIMYDNNDISRFSVKRRKQSGIGYVPSERAKNGALLRTSIKENFLLGYQDEPFYKKYGFIDAQKLTADTYALIDAYDIRHGGINHNFGSLSGGNQQKVVLAREVSKDIKFLLAAQPIRGLDIGATNHVHKTLLRLRDEGKGILLISAELSELLTMSDRIIVMHDGEITGHFTRGEFDEFKIGLAMLGRKEGEANNA